MTQFQLHTIDLPSLHRSTVGFDQLFDQLNRTFANSRQDGTYPPYNIAKLDDTHYVVEVAVAGFKETELDVELKEGVLTVKGEQVKPESAEQPQYLHKGISARNFSRTFTLSPDMEVRGATVQNGILAIALEHVVPEEKLAKKIAITYQK
jgi:molecular chaperone IbpA